MFIKSYIGPLLLTFCISVFVLLMQFLWKYVDDLVGKGLDTYIIMQLMYYASITFIPLALPLAILLSSLMTYGNFGEHYELAAAKSVGISLKKMMYPLAVVCILLAGFAFFFSNNMLPYANLKMRSILYDVTNTKPALNIKEGIFYRDIDNIVLKIGRKEKDGKSIKNILIYDHSKYSGNTSITMAESGYMETTKDEKYLTLQLYNGYSFNEQFDNREHYISRPLERVYFKEQYRRFDLSSFAMQRTDENFFKDHYQMMNIKQLNYSTDSLRKHIAEKQNNNYKNLISYWYYFSTRDGSYIKTHNKNDKYFINELSNDEKTTYYGQGLQSAKNMKEMASYQNIEIQQLNKYIIRYKIEYYRKFTLSVACIILFFIGAPLGAIIRKGGLGLPLVVAALIFIFYYILSITGEKFAKEGVWTPIYGMWLSSIILLPFGAWLTYKATTDSQILDSDWYSTLLDRFKKHKKNEDITNM